MKVLEVTIGAYHTSSQLQQNPTSRGGVIFKREDWKFYTVLPEMEERIISVDATFKDLKDSDYVAIQVWGRRGANKYLLKRLRKQLGFSATVMALRTIAAAFPGYTAILIEDKANGPAIIDTLAKDTTLSAVLPINPEGGKVSRAYAIQPEQEAGNLWLPDPSIDPDIETYLTELCSFPAVTNDDETDATTQAINWLKNRATNTGILDYYEQLLKQQQAEQGA